MLIRTMQPDELPAIVKVYVDTFQATHKGIVSDTFLNTVAYDSARQRFEEMLSKQEHRPFCYVAEDHGKIVGYALGGLSDYALDDYQGELKTIYILPEYQRLGIGRNLIRTIAEHFQREQVSSMFLGVFKDNYPARRFYEALGGRKIEEHRNEIGDEYFAITFYGWPSVHELIQLIASSSPTR